MIRSEAELQDSGKHPYLICYRISSGAMSLLVLIIKPYSDTDADKIIHFGSSQDRLVVRDVSWEGLVSERTTACRHRRFQHLCYYFDWRSLVSDIRGMHVDTWEKERRVESLSTLMCLVLLSLVPSISHSLGLESQIEWTPQGSKAFVRR